MTSSDYDLSVEQLTGLGVLTRTQARYLTEIREKGEVWYFGQALRPIKALERLELIKVEYGTWWSGRPSQVRENACARPVKDGKPHLRLVKS